MKGIVVFENEIDRIANVTGAVNYAFLGMAFGAWLTTGATLLSVELSGKPLGVFAGACVASTVLSAFFGYKAYDAHRASLAEVVRLKGLMEDLVISEKL